MKKIVITIGSYCYNRGSEALVRGTIEILKKHFPDCNITVCSGEQEFNSSLCVPDVDRYVRRQSYYNGISLNRILNLFYRKILKNIEKADQIKYKDLLRECKDADLVIVSGGDNYDKSYGMFHLMHSVNKAIRSTSSAKMVMYDCSLAESEITEEVQRDFALFDAVTAREKDTYTALKKKLSTVPVYYFPDPAFAMHAEETMLPECFAKGKVVGVNLSTMAVESQYGSDKQTVLKAYTNMINWILENTDLNVMLLPHVMRGLDLKVLRELYTYYENESRVCLIDNENLKAAELKYIISRCDFYVGARTHSTIAAYSSCVPTLVLGYSVKSIGIAKDLFGRYEGYVVPVGEICESSLDFLQKSFKELYEHEQQVKETLNRVMPNYIDKAMDAGELFDQLIGDKK